MEKGMSPADRRVLMQLENTTDHVGDRYQVGMLWRSSDVWLPNNRTSAEKRLQSIRRKLLMDEDYAKKYCKFMNMLIERQYARKLTPEEVEKTGPRTWFLPHHGVINPQKPEKLRVVFDAAAKFRGTSLNNQLVQGPDFTNNLTGVLLRFRQHQIAVLASTSAQ
jgi:hypothetical protein